MSRVFVLVFLIFLPFSYSQAVDYKEATKQLVDIDKEFKTQATTAEKLTSSITSIENTVAQAEVCVEDAKKQLLTIDGVLKSITVDQSQLKPSDDINFLHSKRDEYSKQAAECRVYLYRARPVLASLKDNLSSYDKSQIFQRTTPIWNIIHEDFSAPFINFNFNKLLKLSGVLDLTIQNWVVLLLFVNLAWVLSFAFIRSTDAWSQVPERTSYWGTTLVRAIRPAVLPLILFSFLSICMAVIFLGVHPQPSLLQISRACFRYTAFLAGLRFFSATYADTLQSQLIKRGFVVASIILFQYIVVVLCQEQDFAESLIQLLRSIYLTTLVLALVWFFWLFGKTLPQFKKTSGFLKRFLRLVLFSLLMSMIIVEWTGFHFLARYLMLGLLLSFILFGLAWIAIQLINSGMNYVFEGDNPISIKIQEIFGVRPQHPIFEPILLRITLYFAILILIGATLLQIWNAPPTVMDQAQSFFSQGFTLVGISLIPANLLFSLLVFSILHLFGRAVATHVANKHHFEGESYTQVAVASLIGYIGFAVALIVALMLSGVNFTGLAIVAGALSVGIGFGLQNIISNFVSGIILLIEKPIKPGDRIRVGSAEGYVTKIRIRATQITTSDRQDVIIPNSELITAQVTNFMFYDKKARLILKLGVAYGSDLKLVEQLLLQVAKDHKEVMQRKGDEATVVFGGFGDSSLQFELRCIIRNVNDNVQVMSDLNYAIEKIFREHNIELPFPQMDVHLKPEGMEISTSPRDLST